MPKASVVMTVYNGEEFLEQAIESILSQTFEDFEFIIIIEHGSNEKSQEIIARYAQKDKRISLLHNDSKLGIAASLNRGMRAAKGEYIARMDGDDISLTTRLEKQIKFMDENPGIAICATGVTCIDGKGAKVNIIDKCADDPEQIKSDLIFYCFIRHPTVMFRKSIVSERGLFYDEGYLATEDYELWCRAAHVAVVARMPEILLLYRWHKFNATRVFLSEGIRNYLKIMRANFDRLEFYPSEEELMILCTETSVETLRNHRTVKRTLEEACELITSNNRRLGIYDEESLKRTLDRRMYLKKHKVRRLVTISIRSLAVLLNSDVLTKLSRYIEYNGFLGTLKRIFG